MSLKDLTSQCLLVTTGSYKFVYSSWKEFTNYSPWEKWCAMELSHYIWAPDNILYIFYNSTKDANDKLHVAINVKPDDDIPIREWLKERIPKIWKI